MQQWYFEEDDGSRQQVYSDKKPHPKARKIDRFGDLATELHHPKRGWQPRGVEALHAAIDDAHRAEHGLWRQAVDYAAKELEARLLLAGIDVHGRLAREASARGVPLLDLANSIIANADRENVEDNRVAAKIQAARGEQR